MYTGWNMHRRGTSTLSSESSAERIDEQPARTWELATVGGPNGEFSETDVARGEWLVGPIDATLFAIGAGPKNWAFEAP
jgi:hypothetical protein